MEKINGNDWIMPTEDIMPDGEIGNLKGGLTKREYFAAMTLQGLCELYMSDSETKAKIAVSMADALIKELNK